jgi:hypothetical protein
VEGVAIVSIVDEETLSKRIKFKTINSERSGVSHFLGFSPSIDFGQHSQISITFRISVRARIEFYFRDSATLTDRS